MPFTRLPIVTAKQGRQCELLASPAKIFGFLLGLMVLSTLAPASAQAGDDMSFQIVSVGNPSRCGASCPQMIAAEGQITGETPQIFREFVRAHYAGPNLRAIILIDSNGGKVLASMELGKIFRQIGAAVIVGQPASGAVAGGSCLSACVYALMGGRKRVIPLQSQAGVHRMVAYDGGYDSQFSDGGATMRLDNGTVAAVLSRYSAAMGVNPAIIAKAEHIPPGALHVLSRAEIARWNLAASRL